MEILISVVIIVVLLIIIVAAAVKVVQEYERGVIFRLGRLVGPRGPGIFVIIPFIDRMRKVDLRTVVLNVPSQDAITKDNVTLKVDAVVYFRVVRPSDSVVKVFDHTLATSQISQTTLRSVIGASELDDLLAHREKVNQTLQRIIDEQTDPWGVKVSVVEVKQVELPEAMQRAIAAQAEAERMRRAKIIHAEGEFQAAERLAQAAHIIAQEPTTLQLRYLQTLTEIASERNSTIIFPLPIDLIRAFLPAAAQPQPTGIQPPQRAAAPLQPAAAPPQQGEETKT